MDGQNPPPVSAELLFSELQLLNYKATAVLCPSFPGSHLPMFCIPESKASRVRGDVSMSLTGMQFPCGKDPALACTCALEVADADPAQKSLNILKPHTMSHVKKLGMHM